MTEFAGAVDLGAIGGTLGPAQAEALMEELRQMAATREQALRDRVAAVAENEGLHRLLAAVAYHYGAHDAETGERRFTLNADEIMETNLKVAGVSVDHGDDEIVVSVLLLQNGSWEVTGRKPSDEEKNDLPIYEHGLPDVTTPGPLLAIVQTPKGLRVAEWTPA